MIKNRTGNILTEHTPGTYLTHACNAKGYWGAGIAADIACKFPLSFWQYRAYCKLMGDNAVGTVHVSTEGVISLICSNGYGREKDPVFRSLNQMAEALDDLSEKEPFASSGSLIEIHSPRIGAGLFGVPWPESEKLIYHFALSRGIDWTVWTLT